MFYIKKLLKGTRSKSLLIPKDFIEALKLDETSDLKLELRRRGKETYIKITKNEQ